VSERKSVLDFEKKDVLPRFLFERMIWSKSMMEGSLGGLASRSWMNSLKPKADVVG